MGIYEDMKKDKTLIELFSFPGFLARKELEGRFGDPRSRIIILDRKKKQQAVLNVALFVKVFTIEKFVYPVIVMSRAIGSICVMNAGECIAENVMVCTWKL